MKKKWQIITFLVFTFLSCERPVELNLDQNIENLVLISPFSNQSFMNIQLSKARSVLETKDSLILFFQSDVQLFANDIFIENLELTLNPQLEIPTFQSSFIPIPGVNYKVVAKIPQYETMEATSSIPAPVIINTLKIDDLEITTDENRKLQIQKFKLYLVFSDPPQQLNYYHVKIFQDIKQFLYNGMDTIYTNTIRKELTFNSAFNNNNNIANFDGGLLFDDKNFEGQTYVHVFDISIPLNYEYEKPGALFLELRTTSKEYFFYFSSLSKQLSNSNGPFSEPVILYDNIENGLGIFAGYAVEMDSTKIVQ